MAGNNSYHSHKGDFDVITDANSSSKPGQVQTPSVVLGDFRYAKVGGDIRRWMVDGNEASLSRHGEGELVSPAEVPQQVKELLSI